MKKLSSLLLFVFLCSTYEVLCQKNYKVFITALEKEISTSYFTGLNNLTFEKYVNDLYKVYAGTFAEKTAAEQVVQDAISKGYKYARVIDLQLQQEICSQSCREPFWIRNIFLTLISRYYEMERRQISINWLIC